MGPPPPSPRIEGQQAHLHHQQQQQRERSNNRWSSAARPAAVPVVSSYASLACGPPPSFAAAAASASSSSSAVSQRKPSITSSTPAVAASNSSATATNTAASTTSNREIGYRGATLSLSSSSATGRGPPRRGGGGRFDGSASTGRGGRGGRGTVGYRGGGAARGGEELSLTSVRRSSIGNSNNSDSTGRTAGGRAGGAYPDGARAGRGRGRTYFERGGGRSSYRGGGGGGRGASRAIGDERRGSSLDRQDSFSGMDQQHDDGKFHSRGSFAEEGRLSPYSSYAGRGGARASQDYGDSPPGEEHGNFNYAKRRRGDESFMEYPDDKRMRETDTSTPPPEGYGRLPDDAPPLPSLAPLGDDGGQFVEATEQQQPPPPTPLSLPNQEPHDGDLAEEAYRNRLADEGRWSSPNPLEQQDAAKRNQSWTGLTNNARGGAPPGLSSPHQLQQQARRSMYTSLDANDEPPYSTNDWDSAYGRSSGRGRGARGRGYRGGRGGRVVSDYSSIARGDYARFGDGPPTRSGSVVNRLSITAPDAPRGGGGEASPRPSFVSGDVPWKRPQNDFGAMAGPPPTHYEDHSSPRGSKPSPRDWRALPSHYGAMSAGSNTPLSAGSGMRSHLTPSSGDFPIVPFPGPGSGDGGPYRPQAPTPPPPEEVAQIVKTPPPSPGSPSGLAVALTRLTDLEAQMEFAYAKFILMMKRHEVIKAQFEHLEKLPVGVDAFKEDLEKLGGFEGGTIINGDQES